MKTTVDLKLSFDIDKALSKKHIEFYDEVFKLRDLFDLKEEGLINLLDGRQVICFFLKGKGTFLLDYPSQQAMWKDVKRQIGWLRYAWLWLASLMPVKREFYLRDDKGGW